MKKCLLATTLLFLMGEACLAQNAQPSLADVARTRQSTKKARVITNDDIATASPQIESEPANTKKASTTADSTSTSGTEAKAGEKKESGQSSSSASSKDSSAAANLKKKLDGYKEEQDSWKRSAKRYEDLLANENDSFRRQMYQDALEGDKRNVAMFQEKIDQTQAQLAKTQK